LVKGTLTGVIFEPSSSSQILPPLFKGQGWGGVNRQKRFFYLVTHWVRYSILHNHSLILSVYKDEGLSTFD
jgi:hypothetical protein